MTCIAISIIISSNRMCRLLLLIIIIINAEGLRGTLGPGPRGGPSFGCGPARVRGIIRVIMFILMIQ